MSETYNAIREAALQCFDISHYTHALFHEALSIAYEYKRPSAVFRPAILPDGNAWCALYGTNIQEGVCGFGASPEEACQEFDKAWVKKNT